VIEAIGGIMWFADQFFKITGADKLKLFQVEGIEVEEAESTVKVTVDKELLRNGDTNQQLIEIQDSLRSCLFP